MSQQPGTMAKCAMRGLIVLLSGVLLHGLAQAAGTSAGTSVSNTATAEFSIASVAGSASSNTVTFRVDEKLDVNLSWQDAANITVNSPDSNRVLSFLLTNTGNGNDSYALSVQNNLGGDQFDPSLVDIYLDANANGIFDPGVDTLYVAGSNDPVLAPDASLAVFVRNNIPAALSSGNLGRSQLIATSKTLSGAPGTALAGAGDAGTAAIVGTSGGSASSIGVYQINGATVSLVKSVVVIDPLGGTQPTTGATLTYSIAVNASGGTASNVMISDPIPANTTYVAGSLTLNGASLSDAADGDAGDVGVSAANTVTVNLGNISSAASTQTISFKVIIN